MNANTDADGFVSLFNGMDVTGWIGATNIYGVNHKEPGILQYFPGRASSEGDGNLCTEKEYRNFILRFEFCMSKNGKSGLGIRMKDNQSDESSHAMCELPLLDDGGDLYYDAKDSRDKVRGYQYTGSIYGIVPSRRDNINRQVKRKEKTFAGGGSYLKRMGRWNFGEVFVVGSEIEVYLNGILIAKANLSRYKGDGTDTPDLEPHSGLRNMKGRIGWIGYGHNVKWRNIRIKELPDDAKMDCIFPLSAKECPEGFVTLFDGSQEQLSANWKGVTRRERFDNPIVRQTAVPKKRADMQKVADEQMVQHWFVRNGALFFDGFKGGYSLAAKKDYRDFELLVDWRILSPNGDSGIYLRGSPQVQIWDASKRWSVGSGGLYNNKKNPSKPLKKADNPVGSWNAFRIKMVGEKVWVWLNGELVVENTTLENYWKRSRPIFQEGQIELQCHGDPIEFRNIFIREL